MRLLRRQCNIFIGIVILLLFLILYPQTIYAETFQTAQTLEVKEDEVSLAFANKFSSSLFNLSYSIYLPNGEVLEASPVSEINPEKEDKQTFTIDFSNLASGRYVIYAKGSFFSSDNPYHTKRPQPFLAYTVFEKEVTGKNNFLIKDYTVDIDEEKGNLHFQVQNQSNEKLDLHCELILPDGIILADKELNITIEPGALESINLKLVNQWRSTGEASQLLLSIYQQGSNEPQVQAIPFSIHAKSKSLPNLLIAFLILAAFYLIAKYYFKLSPKICQIIILVFIYFVIFEFIPLGLIFSNTTTTGGDTFSHYAASQFMKEELFPKFKISGWYPGSYAGFPLFVFYMPLPFLLISILSLIIKFNIAFKLVTILGIVGLPIGAYFLAKELKFPKFGALLAAFFCLIFLFNESYTMYGGNVLSTLAGEFANGMGIVLLLIFTGTLYGGIRNYKSWKLNAIFLFLITFTHPFPFILAVLQQIFFVLPKFNSKGEIKKNFIYLLKVDCVAFLLSAFWSIPSVLRLSYTTPLDEFWPLEFDQIIPRHFILLFIVSIITGLFGYIFKKRQIVFLTFNIYISVIMLLFSNKLGLVNVRFIPFVTLYVLIIAAYGLSYVLKIFGKQEVFRDFTILIFIGLTIVIVGSTTHIAPHWARWNYTGVENKPYSGLFVDIMNYLKDLPGNDRVVYEHSTMQENFGTNRTFETLYGFTEKPVLEGLYIQSSSTSPFIYYMQSEVSEIATNVIVGNEYTTFDADFDKTINHLKQFNVRYYIAVSDKVKKKLLTHDEFSLLEEFYPYNIFELETNGNSYISVLSEKPVFVDTKNWKKDSYEWFTEGDVTTYVNDPNEINFEHQECNKEIEIQEISNEEIEFKTGNIGCPHLIKVSYFPNWKVKGAERVYQASPNFMLIYPTEESVELYYGNRIIEYFSLVLTVIGVFILIFYRSVIKFYYLKFKKYSC